MKINYYYLNVKKKINNFQIIIINNLAFFSVYNKGYFSGQKDHSKNIFHETEQHVNGIFISQR